MSQPEGLKSDSDMLSVLVSLAATMVISFSMGIAIGRGAFVTLSLLLIAAAVIYATYWDILNRVFPTTRSHNLGNKAFMVASTVLPAFLGWLFFSLPS